MDLPLVTKEQLETDSGSLVISEETLMHADDPEQLKHDLSKEYTRLVQENPLLRFGITHDAVKGEIRISWFRPLN